MRPITDDDLDPAATNLVTTALRVAAGERFVIVGDRESTAIVGALDRAGRAAGADVHALLLDEHRSYSTNHSGERPHKVLPDAVRRAMLAAQASAFVASSPHAEASMREQLIHCVGACRVRHAHLGGTTPLAFTTSLRSSGAMLADAARDMERRLQDLRELTVESPGGTRLRIALGPSPHWIARTGKIRPGESVVFPAGSLVSTPESLSGRFVAVSVGELGAGEGHLGAPIAFEIEAGLVTRVDSAANGPLVREIQTLVSHRVGLVVIGLDAGIGPSTGMVDVDQNRPGLHLHLGDRNGRGGGATGSSGTTFAVCDDGSIVRDPRNFVLVGTPS